MDHKAMLPPEDAATCGVGQHANRRPSRQEHARDGGETLLLPFSFFLSIALPDDRDPEARSGRWHSFHAVQLVPRSAESLAVPHSSTCGWPWEATVHLLHLCVSWGISVGVSRVEMEVHNCFVI